MPDQLAPLVEKSDIWKRLRAFAKPWVMNRMKYKAHSSHPTSPRHPNSTLASRGRARPDEPSWLQAKKKAEEDLLLAPTEGLHGLISDLWLEFDASENKTPEPSVFIGLDDQLQQLIKELNPAYRSSDAAYTKWKGQSPIGAEVTKAWRVRSP